MAGFWKHLPPPGLRIVKTALAVLCTLLLYDLLLGRQGVAYAAVAAVVCMQDSVGHSIRGGVNRLLGTVLGGGFGVALSSIHYLDTHYILWALAAAVGLLALMYLCNAISKPGSIVIASVVYLMIALSTMQSNTTQPLRYAGDRLLDTAVGVVVAVAVNWLVFRPKPQQPPGHGEAAAPPEQQAVDGDGASVP